MKGFTKVFLGIAGLLMTASFIAVCSSGGDDSAKSLQIAPNEINLGKAATFAVLGGSAGVTNQGTATVLMGDMGTSGASTMITGFHDASAVYTETPLNIGVVSGKIYTAGPTGTAAAFAIVTEALADATSAYNYLSKLSEGKSVKGDQLGGKKLTSGVYKAQSDAFLLTGGDLTLDAKNNKDAVWVFQMKSSLTVGAPAAPCSVILANGAQAKNVYWVVGSAATINGAGGGAMVGTIISKAGATFSTAGNTAITKLNGRVLSLVASVTLVNTVVNSFETEVSGLVIAEKILSHITLSGKTSGDVSPTITGGGFINVQNNGAHVAATVTGTGTLNIVNNGAAVAGTLTGNGTMNLVNNGGPLSATNTGNGQMTVSSTCSAAVTVTNTGNGNIRVNASGSEAITLTYTDGGDHTYGTADALALIASRVSVTGVNSGDVTPVLTGEGYINVMNNGAHVAATQTGKGTINIVNNGVGCVIAATNTGNGVMSINSTATAAVTVTNTGNGKITVYATGDSAITITHNGDDDYTYGNTAALALMASHITVSGSRAIDTAAVLNGDGYLNIVNNGAHVAATETGNGTINIVNNGQVLTATNTGNGIMKINSTCTGAVTVTNTGNGNITVNATGTTPITLTYSDGLDHFYPAASNELAALMSGSAASSYIIPTITGGGFINVVNNVNYYVTATVTGLGTINVLNNGQGVTATLTGNGPMNIVNSGTGPLTVTNTGNGKAIVNSSCSAAVTVTNTGNGRVTVFASGTDPITLTHTGDDDYMYNSNQSVLSLVSSHIIVSGSNVGGVTTTLTGSGYLNIVNDSSAAVTVTESSSGTINVINKGSAAVTATESGGGKVNVINHTADVSGAVTATNSGTGMIAVDNIGTVGLTVTNAGNGKVTLTNSSTAGAVTVTNTSQYHINVIGTNGGGTFDNTVTQSTKDNTIICNGSCTAPY